MRRTLCLTAAFTLMLTSAFAEKYDVLIRNGCVIDGSGNPWRYADVAVKGSKIAAIGNLADAEATTTIDAKHRVVAPGFIDVHTHADEDMITYPLAENFLRDGVTTIITGNCGGSMTDVADYFATMEEQGTGPNVATLIGHNSILRRVKGGPIQGELDQDQMTSATLMVEKAMEAGAMGLSTGLIYTPGLWSDTQEIIALAKVAAKYDGIYATHMRSEAGNIQSAIEEALQIGREAGIRVQISHFKMPADVAAKIGGSNTTLAMVQKARDGGQEVWVDQYPYTASSTTISTMLPDWVLEDGPSEAKKILQNNDQLPRVLEDMRQSHEVSRSRKDLSYAVIASTSAYPGINGKNIKQVAQILKLQRERGEDFDWKSLPESEWPTVTMEDQYRTVLDIYVKGGAGMIFHTMLEEDVENIMASPLVSIASDSGVRRLGVGVPHPRGYGSNARVLGRYVRERGIITLEEAIRKMTSMPATAFRIHDRGLLQEGLAADIVVFDPDTVIDNASFDDPHHYSTGFDAVLVNGVLVVRNDEVTGEKPGRPVRRSTGLRSTALAATTTDSR